MKLFRSIFSRRAEPRPDAPTDPYPEQLRVERNVNFNPERPLSSVWNYFCPCGTKLTEGPEGGGSVNAVCETCRINYGCLPGYYGDA